MIQSQPGSVGAGTPRLTVRTAIGAVLCCVGLVGVSCAGEGCTTATGPSGGPTGLSSALAADYVLSYTSTSGLPVYYADSAGYQLRVWSDTVHLKLSDSTYTEDGRTSRYDPVSKDELIRNYRLPAAGKVTIAAANLTFPKLVAGAATAVAQPGYGNALLEVTFTSSPTRKWIFYPKFVPVSAANAP